MSIQACRAVWAISLPTPSLKLTLLALAECHNAETGRLNPSIATIAAMAGLSRSQAQRNLRELGRQGLVSIALNANGGSPSMTPRYVLHLDLPPMTGRILATTADRIGETGSARATGTAHATGSTPGTGRTDATGGAGAQDGAHGCAGGVASVRQRGRIGATRTGMNRNEPEGNLKRARATTRAAESPLPTDFRISTRVREWASSQGFADLEAHHDAFIGKALARGYRYVDWDQAFMNAIRADWAGLRRPRSQQQGALRTQLSEADRTAAEAASTAEAGRILGVTASSAPVQEVIDA